MEHKPRAQVMRLRIAGTGSMAAVRWRYCTRSAVRLLAVATARTGTGGQDRCLGRTVSAGRLWWR